MSTDEEPLSKRPQETQFHQQTLLAWKPLILMSTVFPFFAGIGSLFLLIGLLLLIVSISVNELTMDYTDCISNNPFNGSSVFCSNIIDKNATSEFKTCTCIIPFEIKARFNGQVYLYYLIQNLYQNHRRYVKSKDDYQLSGKYVEKVSSDCDPYGSIVNGTNTFNYAPCGIIANSLFNDSFELRFIVNESAYLVPMTSKGIAWKVDTDILFGKPKNWDLTIKPINWAKAANQRSNDSYKGDEELLVWMRTSPLPDFKKLHRIIENDRDPFKSGLPAGQYELKIEYAYPVTMFKGRKSVVLSTTSFMGGKNHNMAIMYIVVGSIQLIIAIIFGLYTFIKRDQSYQDVSDPVVDGHSDGCVSGSGPSNRSQGKEYYGSERNNSEDTPLITSQSTRENYGVSAQ